jgi:thiol:disulfide interchange protein DsbG
MPHPPLRRRHTLALLAALALAPLAGCDRGTPASGSSPAASPDTAWQLASQQASGFSVGPLIASHSVYVFFDPACPHCAELWTAAQPLLGRMRMVWIPVGFLQPGSAAKGATILAAVDPAAEMNRNESSLLSGGPGIEPAASLPAGALDKVKANTALFQRIGADSVPFLVYLDPQTRKPAVHAGAMDSDHLAELLGL